MTIYFAGSISGGRDDVEFYADVVKKLSPYGRVSTEHVADKNLDSYGETALSAEGVYTREAAWLAESDAVVAEITTPSLGVGYELGHAEALKKKILCIYREQEGKRVSAMIVGNPHFTIQEYKEPTDLDEVFKKFFANMV